MRLIALLLAAALLLPLFVSCTMRETGEVGAVFTDDSGATVRAPREPLRVAVLFSSLAELWQLAGGETSITVGESVERGIVSGEVSLVDAGAGKQINEELLIAASPDLIIGSADIPAQREAVALARELHIPAALFHLESFSDYLRILGIMTKITKNPTAYSRYGEALSAEIDEIKSAIPSGAAPSVLFIRAGSTAASTKAKRAEDHFAAAMLSELGARNIADDAPILLDGLSLEAILLADPDLILIVTMGSEAAALLNIESLLRSPAWQTLSAVRAGKVHILPKELFQYKPNGGWADAYRHLAELLYDEP